jgi:hypothetical protein
VQEVAAAVAAAEAAAASISSDDDDGRTLDRRPTLRDIHGAGSLAQSFRMDGVGPGLTQFDWQVRKYYG